MNFNENSLEPPFTDRGVVNTQTLETKAFLDNDIEMVFDWLQVTIQGYNIDDVVYNLFKCKREVLLHTPSGRYGYNNTITFGERILIFWHDSRVDMGVHVLLSGSACRELEELLTWKTFFDRLFYHNVVKFTRVDVALDCFKKYFDVNDLRKKVVSGELVSRFRQSTYMEQLRVEDGSQESASLKFGSMSSDIYIVFYDKLAERKNAHVQLDSSIDFWVRCEIRFKHDLSNHIIKLFMQNDYTLGSYVNEILYNYIDFKDFDIDSNKSRWQTSNFWLSFLGTVDKLNIAPKATSSTIERKQKWFFDNLSKTALMLSVVNNNFYDDLLKAGENKLSKSDLDIINAHLISQGITPLTIEDVDAIYKQLVGHHYVSLSDALKTEQLQLKEVSTW